ncbi:unnamed protein product [Albugo candida]|uniref:Uncharacterized protein n=1 Tax=Albugo candida TaxID=65357 RepID=A0A024G0H8_9STRA|nr:unnamed protein product [Albugo candida]|eukprot:CCI40058.1 unnamed protein product [Albugo candida]
MALPARICQSIRVGQITEDKAPCQPYLVLLLLVRQEQISFLCRHDCARNAQVEVIHILFHPTKSNIMRKDEEFFSIFKHIYYRYDQWFRNTSHTLQKEMKANATTSPPPKMLASDPKCDPQYNKCKVLASVVMLSIGKTPTKMFQRIIRDRSNDMMVVCFCSRIFLDRAMPTLRQLILSAATSAATSVIVASITK